jgi:uncharacterized protein (TIGR02246 family)
MNAQGRVSVMAGAPTMTHRGMRIGRAALCVGLLLLAIGCKGDTSRDTAAVKASLDEYSRLVLAMDHHRIAQLYAADGVLDKPGKPLRGPEEIEQFLRGFDAYKVLAYSAVAETTRVHGDEAHQAGTYRQRVRLPSSDTVEVHGRFRVDWQRGTGGWLIRKMSATPER